MFFSQEDYNKVLEVILEQLDEGFSVEKTKRRIKQSMIHCSVDSPLDSSLYGVAEWLSMNDVPTKISRRELVERIAEETGLKSGTVTSIVFKRGFKKTIHLCTEKELKWIKIMKAEG